MAVDLSPVRFGHLTFNLLFHIPCTHTPEITDMHRGVCDKNNVSYAIKMLLGSLFPSKWNVYLQQLHK